MATRKNDYQVAALKPAPQAQDLNELLPVEEEVDFNINPIDSEVFTVDTMSGEVEEINEGEEEESVDAPFDANIADYLSEEELDEIGPALVELVENDKKSRSQWYDKLKKGLERLGVYNPDDTSDTGIAKVSHPLLLEAATQFQARAMSELMPPTGPVKASVVGERTPETEAQRTRVEDYMNYQLTVEDRTYYDERDQMYFLLPFTGSEFDKQYFDPAVQHVVSRWVRCDDFVVPYNTSSLEEASRYTHIVRLNGNALRKKMVSGFYLDIDLPEPSDTEENEAPLTEKMQELDGQTKVSTLDPDKEYVLYEIHTEYDVPGMEEPTALPYVITVDSESHKVLSIYRNWKENDALQRKRIWFTHKKFLPGFGFYGFGLLHAIGNLGDAASDILQILIDSGAFATLQGGFKSIDAKIKGDITLQAGVWMDTEMTSEELGRSFYTPPWKEPSSVMLGLLGTIVDSGQKFAATTETMTGDAATTGPVGTMVAQIEQGSKVFSGIHKRLHKAQGDEFIHIGELNGEHLPEVYPYRMGDQSQNVLRSDFDDRIDIIPVSDPNIVSSAQRIAMAQAALQLTSSMPDIADRREAAIRLLQAMRYTDPEKIFPPVAEAERADPLSEGSLLLMGRPIRAYLEQDHQSHLSVHQGQAQGLPPQIAPMMQSHMFEHMAMEQYKKFVGMGVQLPPINWEAKKNEPMMQQVPPEVEAQIAVMSAQAMQQMMQEMQQKMMEQQGEGKEDNSARKEAQKDEAFQREQQRRDEAFQREQDRRNAAAGATVDREDAKAGISPTMVKQAQEFIIQNRLQMSPRELAVMSKALGVTFEKVVEAISRMAMSRQGGTQFEQTQDFSRNSADFT